MKKAVDLFAGGGGLTVGLKAAGFNVISAVENAREAARVYKANHPEVDLFDGDIREVSGRDLRRLLPGEVVDLIAGCPPCQGFTSLTSKYKRDDARNSLIDEMRRIIVEVRPRAVMMENVPGLSLKGKDRLNSFIDVLKSEGYVINWKVVQVADYGTPQFRRRLVLLAGRGFSIAIPKPTHSKNGEDGLSRWRTVRDVICGLPKPETFRLKVLPKGGTVSDWHYVRQLSPENKERIQLAKPGGSWSDYPDEKRPNCHRNGYRGFSNVYGRMSWDAVAPTMTAGCTTLSKGRFGHPAEDRTISLREAALLQEFPDDYKLPTPYMEYACSVVGNALPCGFAEAMARQVSLALDAERT